MGSKKKLAAKLEQATHANSRRTRAVIRDIKKMKKRDIIKSGFASKVRTFKELPKQSYKSCRFQANVEAKKLLFFSEKIEGKEAPLTPEEFEAIIQEYVLPRYASESLDSFVLFVVSDIFIATTMNWNRYP